MSGSSSPNASTFCKKVGFGEEAEVPPRRPPRGTGTARAPANGTLSIGSVLGGESFSLLAWGAWRGCVRAPPPPFRADAGEFGVSGAWGRGKTGEKDLALHN